MAKIIANVDIKNKDVIKSIEAPYSSKGGLAVLFGNLAPEGAIVKNCRSKS